VLSGGKETAEMLCCAEHDGKCCVEGRMLYLILLVIFLIQFLVVLVALSFVIFTARPEVPFSGNGMKERTAPDDRDRPSPRPPEEKPPTSGKNASGSSKDPAKRVTVTQPPTLVAFARPS
jgi:flagellar basal body-associated protein FliL